MASSNVPNSKSPVCDRTLATVNDCNLYRIMAKLQIHLPSNIDLEIVIFRVHKFRYGRIDCIPTDPKLPYKAFQHENHPGLHSTGTETVEFMKREFNMPAEEFIGYKKIRSQVLKDFLWSKIIEIFDLH